MVKAWKSLTTALKKEPRASQKVCRSFSNWEIISNILRKQSKQGNFMEPNLISIRLIHSLEVKARKLKTLLKLWLRNLWNKLTIRMLQIATQLWTATSIVFLRKTSFFSWQNKLLQQITRTTKPCSNRCRDETSTKEIHHILKNYHQQECLRTANLQINRHWMSTIRPL